MIPRLEAQESLREAARISVGSGRLAARDRRKILSGWERQAADPRDRPKPRGFLQQLQDAGVPIVRVRKKKAETP
jgi:hypothetical protein